MKQKKSNLWKQLNSKRLLTSWLSLLLGGLLLVVGGWKGADWGRLKLDGEMYGTMAMDRVWLYVGDNNGGLRAINKKTGKVRWHKDLEGEVFKTALDDSSLLIMHGDSVMSLDTRNGNEQWKFVTNNFFDVSDFFVKGKLVVVFDRGGNVYGLRVRDGEMVWQQLRSSQPETMEAIFSSEYGPRWHSLFQRLGNTLIYVPAGGSMYAVDLRTGALIWQQESNDTIVSLALGGLNKELLVGRKSGLGEVRDWRDGNLIRSTIYSAELTCLAEYDEIWWQPIEVARLMKAHFPTGHLFYGIWQLVATTFELRLPTVGERVELAALANGTLVGKSTEGIWELAIGTGFGCPVEWYDRAYIKTQNGRALAVNVRTGSVIWEQKLAEGMLDYFGYHFSSSKRDLLRLVTGYDRINVPDILISNARGGWLLRGGDGSIRWHNTFVGRVYDAIYSRRDGSYYLASTRGLVSKIDASNGNYYVEESNVPMVSMAERQFGKVSMHEWEIHHEDSGYINPFSDVTITAWFRHESGKEFRVTGFYYDRDTWKVRFVPSHIGRWEYTIDLLSPYGAMHAIDSGNFVASSDSHDAYVQLSKSNSSWLTTDGTTIWNGVGFQDWPEDRNWNGNLFDDYSLGVETGEVFVATTSAGISFSPGVNTYVSLEKYVQALHGNGWGLNLYRWNLNFPQHNLMQSNMLDLVIDLQKAREVEEMMMTMKTHDVAVWATLFHFWFPFAWDLDYIKSSEYIRPYISYFVSRYGPLVDVWELTNESHLNDNLMRSVIGTFREVDYQNKLLTTSWERPEIEGFDLIAPHWYESENLLTSDLVTISRIKPLQRFDKPIIFGEQGNVVVNDDDTSATRMRVRLWTAFMHESLLAFWNTAHFLYVAPSNKYANINLGEAERSYIQVFRKLSAGLSLDSTMYTPNLMGCGGVRSYGLSAPKKQLVYLFNPQLYGVGRGCRIYANDQGNGRIAVFNPENGEKLIEGMIGERGYFELLSFERDLVVQIDYGEN